MTYAKQFNGVWVESVSLPQQYIFADGSRTGRFDLLDASFHAAEGYYPVSVVAPEHDDKTERLVLAGYELTNGVVVKTMVVEQIPLDELRRTKCNEIQSRVDSLLLNTTFEFDGVEFNLSPAVLDNITQLQTLVSVTGQLPALTWTAKDGSEYPLTAANFVPFSLAAASKKLGIVTAGKQHIAAVMNATAQEVADYDYNVGILAIQERII